MSTNAERGAETASIPPASEGQTPGRTRDLETREDAELECSIPTRVGKYELQGLLGRGGMGSVYAAVDPDLEREVAIKVLKESMVGRGASENREALLHEAKALAKLNHPNVVSVYEVGETEGEVFIAMERVRGRDLRAWLRGGQTPRLAGEVLARFLEAGRGLEAAHEAGLIHRDFKPANVLISEQGAKVTDFGLAMAFADPTPDGATSSDSAPLASTIMGTPSYMSPEQHRGEALDATSDQYSFCVSLYEGLVGARPFSRQSGSQLLKAKQQGPPPLPSSAKVSARAARAIERGLSADPAERFEDMAALLRELSYDAAAARRRMLGWVGLLTTGAAVAWAALGRTNDLCKPDSEALSGVWDTRVEKTAEAAFDDSGLPFARVAFERSRARLDAYASEWVEGVRDACEATHIHNVQSSANLQVRNRCLHDARAAMQGLTAAMMHPTEALIENTDELLSSLPSVRRCSDIEYLRSQDSRLDPRLTDEVHALRRELASIRILLAAARIKEAAIQLNELQDRVDAADFAPLSSELQLLTGRLHTQQGSVARAEKYLQSAAWGALAADQDEVVARASYHLVWNLANDQSRYQEAFVWLGFADAAASDVLTGEEFQGRLKNTRGMLLQQTGNLDAAALEYARVIRELEGKPGPRSSVAAAALTNLAIIESEQRDFEAALALQQRALVLREAHLGRSHPETGMLLNNMSAVLTSLDRLEEADAANLEALGITKARFGEDHPLVADAQAQRARLLRRLGKPEQGLKLYHHALAGLETTYGPSHRKLAPVLSNFGADALELGRTHEALNAFRRSIEIYESSESGPPLGTRVGFVFALIDGESLDEADSELEFLLTKLRAFDGEAVRLRSFILEAAITIAKLRGQTALANTLQAEADREPPSSG